MLKNVKCARCVKCGKEYEAVPNLTNCECGGILDIIYDYDYIKAHFTKETLKNRVNPTMWRYRELLPVEETTPDTPLRVGWSPLYEEPKLAELLGIKKLWVKDDGINPTASLKDRASAMAVAKAGPKRAQRSLPALPPATPRRAWPATRPLRASRPISSFPSARPRARSRS
ncbi:MAG: hypothetical protein V8S92_08125 [Oscillospiraceae bacterium]